jgi:hypothetical protein
MKNSAKKNVLKKKALPKNANGVVMLSGGNPQIPKGDGDAPVKLYIANMPGWKSALGKKLDALIVKNVPKSAKLNKSVRWNSPFYGVEGKGWFVSFHVFAKYVKVTFFAGTSLEPLPPGGTAKSGEVRWIDLHESDASDAATLAQLGKWIRQASKIPGWIVS